MKVLNVLQNQLIPKQPHSLASSTSLFSPISYFGEWNACFCSCPSQNQRVVSTLLLPHCCSHQPLNPDILAPQTGYPSPSSDLPALLLVQGHCHDPLFDYISLEPQKQSPNFIPFLKSNVLQAIIFSTPQPGQCFRCANLRSAWNSFSSFPLHTALVGNKRLFTTGLFLRFLYKPSEPNFNESLAAIQ